MRMLHTRLSQHSPSINVIYLEKIQGYKIRMQASPVHLVPCALQGTLGSPAIDDFAPTLDGVSHLTFINQNGY